MQLRKRLIARKESFICRHCKAENAPKGGKQLNHCRNCLYSLHVDDQIPGDRAGNCKSLMAPATVTLGKRGVYTIIHECLKCGKIISNKAAENDNIEKILSLINKNPKLAAIPHKIHENDEKKTPKM